MKFKYNVLILLFSHQIFFCAAVQTSLESAMSLATIGGQNLTKIARDSAPAVVNQGVYNLIAQCKSPALVVIGTESVALLALSCAQGDIYSGLTSLVNPETMQAAVGVALQSLGEGAAYALGEKVARSAITLSQGDKPLELAHTVISTIAGTGVGYYAWSNVGSPLGQAMALSACSGVILTSLTTASTTPELQSVKEKVMNSLSGLATPVGKVIGVAVVAAGTAALAYTTSASNQILGAVVNATSRLASTESVSAARNMVVSNSAWIQGYRWVGDKFNEWWK